MLAAYYLCFLSALLCSLVLTWYVRRFAIRRGWVAAPKSPRHVHKHAVPRLGGIAVYLSCILTLGIAASLGRLLHLSGLDWRRVTTILAVGSFIFVVGLYDDIRGLPPSIKFAAEISAAILLYWGGLRIVKLSLLGPVGWYIGLPLTIIWVVLVTNAFNLIDGLDGLAAGSGVLSLSVLLLIMLLQHTVPGSLLATALIGGILGFLFFNFNPATIFLGDCGSLFIGFSLAALGMAASAKAPTIVAVAAPVIACGLPIIDTCLSVARRFMSGKPIFSADREHIHHKLLQKGLSQRQAVAVLYGVSGFLGLFSLFALSSHGATIAVVMLVLSVSIGLGVQYLGYVELRELKRVAQRAFEQKAIIANNVAIRRAIDAFAACSTLDQVFGVVESAFERNDFDGFVLELEVAAEAPAAQFHSAFRRAWPNGGSPSLSAEAWYVTLPLITCRGQRYGTLVLQRSSNRGPLLIDLNLLIDPSFGSALAEALFKAANGPLPHVAAAMALGEQSHAHGVAGD